MKTPLPIPELTDNVLECFWAKVDRCGPNECWEWTAGCNGGDYGRFHIKRRGYQATRISYTITRSDPGELNVCHTCDNPGCVNPAHLWAGTTQDNMDDCVEKDRQAKGEDQGSAKLTGEQVHKIIESDEIHRILAEQYGIARDTITRIKMGKSWRHQGGESDGNAAYGNSQTKIRGVFLHKASGKYLAQLNLNRTRYYLGLFDTVSEAEQVVIAKRKELS